MSNTFTVSSIDDLLNAALLLSNDNTIDIDFDDAIKMEFRLIGDRWNGKINIDLALFLVELQKSIIKTSAYAQGLNPRSIRATSREDLKLYFAIQDGSFFGSTEDIKKFIFSTVAGMSEKGRIIVVLSILFCLLGGYSFDSFLEHKKDIALIEHSNKLADIIDNMSDTEKKFASNTIKRPMKKLVSSMKKDDKIVLNDETNMLSKKQLAQRVIPSSKTVTTKHIDDAFRILAIVITDDRNSLMLSKDDIKFSANFKLSTDDLETVWDAEKTRIPLNLLVNADFQDGQIIGATVFGIGLPRTTAEDIDSLIY